MMEKPLTITKQRTLALLLAWLALIFGGCRSRSVVLPEPAPPVVSISFERLLGLLPGVQGSDVTLHEGLPDAFWDPDLREKELSHKKTVRLQSYPFYEEPAALQPESGGQITAALSASGSYAAYSGPKTSGEYNPDYCITWKGSGGETRALVSLEC